MMKRIQELALSFFLAVCAIGILLGALWLRPLLHSQQLLVEDTRRNQAQLMQAATDTKVIVTELSYALAAVALLENRMIQPAEANRMIEESVAAIGAHSDRLGRLAKLLNEVRLPEQRRRW